jgi:hypothetical protein
VAERSWVVGVPGVPPADTCGGEVVERDLVAIGAQDPQLVKPEAQVDLQQLLEWS